MTVTIRPYRAQDLGLIVELLRRSSDDGSNRDLQEAVELLSSDDATALVADAQGEIVGVVLGTSFGTGGWIHRLAVAAGPDRDAVASRLLDRFEADLAERGLGRLFARAERGDAGVRDLLDARGYREVEGVVMLERELPSSIPGSVALADVGGVTIDPSLWDQLKGMDHAKQIIERTVILPLSEPELAARHAVQPPKAIVLFGPPGTGKTTFAKGVASRLAWPFIEIQPSELSDERGEQEAKFLADVFDRVLELPAAVVFVDEVEDLASIRHDARKVGPRVTNEFLKQIPRFRSAPRHLLVCATNHVGSLDPAFLRPGRFDYILPVGPPDTTARAAIWRRYVEEITDEEVDIDALVEASEFFTPADIEFTARKAAQKAFEQEHFEGRSHRARIDDFMAAIETTRPSLSEEVITTFGKDMETFGRY